MEKEAVRWNIKVSKEPDLTLRTFLGSGGVKKGDLDGSTRQFRPELFRASAALRK